VFSGPEPASHGRFQHFNSGGFRTGSHPRPLFSSVEIPLASWQLIPQNRTLLIQTG
jgi:hypothetical protein